MTFPLRKLNHLVRNSSCEGYFSASVTPICFVIVIPELAGRVLGVAGLDVVTLGLFVVVDVVDGLLGGLLVAGALVVTAEGLNSTLPLPLQRPGSTSSQSQGVCPALEIKHGACKGCQCQLVPNKLPEPPCVYGIDGVPTQIQAPEASQVHCDHIGAVSCAGAAMGCVS